MVAKISVSLLINKLKEDWWVRIAESFCLLKFLFGDDANVAFHVTVTSELRFLLPIVVKDVYHISDWYNLLL